MLHDMVAKQHRCTLLDNFPRNYSFLDRLTRSRQDGWTMVDVLTGEVTNRTCGEWENAGPHLAPLLGNKHSNFTFVSWLYILCNQLTKSFILIIIFVLNSGIYEPKWSYRQCITLKTPRRTGEIDQKFEIVELCKLLNKVFSLFTASYNKFEQTFLFTI